MALRVKDIEFACVAPSCIADAAMQEFDSQFAIDSVIQIKKRPHQEVLFPAVSGWSLTCSTVERITAISFSLRFSDGVAGDPQPEQHATI